jgi:uncharacterized protein YecT (DUF1311 family)
MRDRLLLFTLLLVVPDGTSDATPAASTPDCGDMATQTAMNICFANEARQSEQLLEALLQELNAKLEPQQRKALASVQANWVEYRRAHCDWQAAFFDGGSIQPTILSTCYQELTRKRIDELKTDLCEGAGMTGECDASRRYDAIKPASDQ